MSSFRRQLWRGLVTGALWATLGGLIAFVLFPIYLYGAQPWEHELPWIWNFGGARQGAPSREQVLRAAAGFAVLGAGVGFVGGFLRVLGDGEH